MKIMKRDEAAIYLRQAVNIAMQSRCKHVKEGAVILDREKKIVATGSRTLRSATGLCLCRGECAMNDNQRYCPAHHATIIAIRTAVDKAPDLRGMTLCRVMIEDDQFSIPDSISCCTRCKDTVLASGMEMLLWNPAAKDEGCVVYSNDELRRNLHQRVLSQPDTGKNYFPIISV